MSYWENPKPVRRARSVDVGNIADVAAALLDDGGPRALTVRALTQRLGVAPASLYSRVNSAEDLFDLALDHALGRDADVLAAIGGGKLLPLMLAYYRHLVRHPWACRVIAMRAPRGPNYLRLSEVMCVLLVEAGSEDPLGDAYAISNFVIGSAMTAPIVGDERGSGVDSGIAPMYSSLHASHAVDPESIVESGLRALLRR